MSRLHRLGAMHVCEQGRNYPTGTLYGHQQCAWSTSVGVITRVYLALAVNTVSRHPRGGTDAGGGQRGLL